MTTSLAHSCVEQHGDEAYEIAYAAHREILRGAELDTAARRLAALYDCSLQTRATQTGDTEHRLHLSDAPIAVHLADSGDVPVIGVTSWDETVVRWRADQPLAATRDWVEERVAPPADD